MIFYIFCKKRKIVYSLHFFTQFLMCDDKICVMHTKLQKAFIYVTF